MTDARTRINYYLTQAKNVDPKTVSVIPTEEEIWNLTDLDSSTTGMPTKMLIFVSNCHTIGEFPVVRVSKNRKLGDYVNVFLVNVSSKPKIVAGINNVFNEEEMKALFSWIILNSKLLTKFWKSDTLGSTDIIDMVKPLSSSARFETTAMANLPAKDTGLPGDLSRSNASSV